MQFYYLQEAIFNFQILLLVVEGEILSFIACLLFLWFFEMLKKRYIDLLGI
jgi:hypothetical protein